MEVLQGYTYHIKDEYFDFVDDKMLLQNKEDDSYRPTMYCIKDSDSDLYWMVPLSTQYEKYSAIRESILAKGKPCKGIIMGEYDGKQAAFLIQNMFPVTEKYIDHIHTRNGNPVPVKKELQKVIRKNVKSFLALNGKGIKVTFTDIDRLKKIMLSE
ncbi:type III toxin-antitoxin system CptIN family toxin [Pseudobutyrivibrio ruminis]|uniref:Uncharacterized protein n=1 Tax=Pseudobutyrivibrio ruminis TaxID=46206 RepID=A0A2G3DYA7_9FIRM|nr:hypothetical protein [Pseudobutyrivibrio ruminis]PHU35984.1 hypothetical protein CSX01_01765 [Pseudobutyrivibrio ruminis]